MNPTLAARQGSIADYNAKNFNDKKFKFLLKRFNPQPSLQYEKGGSKIHWPLSSTIKLYDTIYDTATKKQRTIRYVPGESSIFVDEQSPDDKVPKREQYAEFVKGEKTIDGYETTLLDFFMKCDFNGSNPHRNPSKPILFILLDSSSGLKQMMKKDADTHAAKQWCYQGPWDEVAAYAKALSLNLSDEPDQIRFHMGQLVDRDVEKFTRGMKDPSVKRKFFIQQAVELNYLTVNASNGTVSWTGGGVISTAPAGKDPIDHLVDATFSKAGEETFKNIMSWLRPDTKESTTIEPPMSEPPVKHNPANDLLATNPNPPSEERLNAMLEEGAKLKAFSQAGPWYSFGTYKVKGIDDLKDLLMTDAKAVELLDSLILKARG